MRRFFNIPKFEEMPNDAFISDLRMEPEINLGLSETVEAGSECKQTNRLKSIGLPCAIHN
jgi:hypothetical protein